MGHEFVGVVEEVGSKVTNLAAGRRRHLAVRLPGQHLRDRTRPRGDAPMEIVTNPATTKGPTHMFTGDVWFDVIAAPPAPSRLRVNAVRFAPGSHTFWHRHANGQTLHVTDGVARVGTRDGTVVELHPGQTIWTPPGEWHWHGAAPETFMSHLAMWETGDGSAPDAEWAEAVSDDQYQGRAERT
jgi:quercetin dioxygenase-like cupin family protein